MRYALNQTVFYMISNRVHSAVITSRMLVENVHDNWNSTREQAQIWNPFGPAGIKYATTHGKFDEHQLFATKEELLKSL